MPEKIKITPGGGLRITSQEISFNFDDFYKKLHAWFVKRHYDFQEKFTKNKEKGGWGREIKLNWEGERKVDEYVKFLIVILIDLEKYSEESSNLRGNLRVTVNSFLILDWKDQFQDKKLKKKLFNIYNKFVLKDKINNYYAAKLYDETEELVNYSKSLLHE